MTMLCVTVDVEDFYEGMAVLGHPLEQRSNGKGLGGLLDQLSSASPSARITLFVVAEYAKRDKRLQLELAELSAAGHEIACHGPDHGSLPERELVAWLTKGRETLEELFQVQIAGFRSPRFDLPEHGDLSRYREELAEAGYRYVSDSYRLGEDSAVREAQVLSWRGVPIGGGSYQRLIPRGLVASAIARSPSPAVVYYHSYDFDGTLPPSRVIRSPALARQILFRERISTVYSMLIGRFGSEICEGAAV